MKALCIIKSELYSITSNPQYGIKTVGILTVPSACWLFSNKAATMRGSAKAEPFSVCKSCVFLSAVLYLSFNRLAW